MNILKTNKTMIAIHTIQDITFNKDMISFKVDGKLIQIMLEKISPRLKAADEMQRNFYKISPSGYGIHWPLIDEDLSVDAMLKQAEQ
jgi:hypothetical protein